MSALHGAGVPRRVQQDQSIAAARDKRRKLWPAPGAAEEKSGVVWKDELCTERAEEHVLAGAIVDER